MDSLDPLKKDLDSLGCLNCLACLDNLRVNLNGNFGSLNALKDLHNSLIGPLNSLNDLNHLRKQSRPLKKKFKQPRRFRPFNEQSS